MRRNELLNFCQWLEENRELVGRQWDWDTTVDQYLVSQPAPPLTPLEVSLAKVYQEDVEVLLRKGETYGDSWKKRGGAGAFMVIARKWDRMENMARPVGWDVFQLEEDFVEQVADLRRYLALLQSEMDNGPGPGYVNQDY